MRKSRVFTKKMFVGCVTAACLLFGMNVFAQQDTQSGQAREGVRPSAGGSPLERLDTNQDGKLSQEEFLAEFSRLDQNQDGQIETSEMPQRPQRDAQGQQGDKSERRPQGKNNGKQGGRQEKAGRDGDRPQGGPRDGFLQHFDKNDDKQVSQDEFLQDFQRLDQDGNGVIEESELPQGPPQDAPPVD